MKKISNKKKQIQKKLNVNLGFEILTTKKAKDQKKIKNKNKWAVKLNFLKFRPKISIFRGVKKKNIYIKTVKITK